MRIVTLALAVCAFAALTSKGYNRVTNPVSIYFITIPNGGGVVRIGVALNVANGAWQNATSNVLAGLTYNVLALSPLEPDGAAVPPPPPGATPHHVVSAWATN